MATFVMAITTSTSPVLAVQSGDDQEPPQYLSSNMVQGELVSVDVEARRFVVKPADGNEMELRFTGKTAVAGANGTRELAACAGSRVSVRFEKTEDARVATHIRVHPKLEAIPRSALPKLPA